MKLNKQLNYYRLICWIPQSSGLSVFQHPTNRLCRQGLQQYCYNIQTIQEDCNNSHLTSWEHRECEMELSQSFFSSPFSCLSSKENSFPRNPETPLVSENFQRCWNIVENFCLKNFAQFLRFFRIDNIEMKDNDYNLLCSEFLSLSTQKESHSRFLSFQLTYPTSRLNASISIAQKRVF